MPTNIEIKARLQTPQRQRDLATRLTDTPPERLVQIDTYFNVPSGRLKLRECNGTAELIFYQRSDQVHPKRSDYRFVYLSDAPALLAVLTAALGLRGVVHKTRLLFQVGQTRVHIDEVANLGSFLELEVQLAPGDSDEHGRAVAADLMRRLEIPPTDLVAGSYIDLLLIDNPPCG